MKERTAVFSVLSACTALVFLPLGIALNGLVLANAYRIQQRERTISYWRQRTVQVLTAGFGLWAWAMIGLAILAVDLIDESLRGTAVLPLDGSKDDQICLALATLFSGLFMGATVGAITSRPMSGAILFLGAVCSAALVWIHYAMIPLAMLLWNYIFLYAVPIDMLHVLIATDPPSCPICHYPKTGIESLRCPECGANW